MLYLTRDEPRPRRESLIGFFMIMLISSMILAELIFSILVLSKVIGA